MADTPVDPGNHLRAAECLSALPTSNFDLAASVASRRKFWLYMASFVAILGSTNLRK